MLRFQPKRKTKNFRAILLNNISTHLEATQETAQCLINYITIICIWRGVDDYSKTNSYASGSHTFTMQQEVFTREVLDSSVIHSVKKKGIVGNVGLEISMLPSANTAISEAFSKQTPSWENRCLESSQLDPNIHMAWKQAQIKVRRNNMGET